MNHDLVPTLDDLLAAAGLADTPPAPAPTPVPWFTYAAGEDPEESRRTQVQARLHYAPAASAAGPTLMARDLWIEWVSRFGGDEDLALECAIQSASASSGASVPHRRSGCISSSGGCWATTRAACLDERYERRGIDAVWNTKPMGAAGRGRVPTLAAALEGFDEHHQARRRGGGADPSVRSLTAVGAPLTWRPI